MSVAPLLRRAGVAGWIAAACVAANAHDDEAAAAARMPRRVALLTRAQAELEHGDATQALDDFERAAMMLHVSDAELGLIRAAMQDGQYRRALAFCAHTAGEHTDDADGGALYAWLLRIGGQGGQSERVLAEARAHTPDAPVTIATEAALSTASPVAAGVLLQAPHRMAPWVVALDASLPGPAARFASNAVLVDDGRAALLPLSALGPDAGARLWVRNGLGQSVEARRDDDAALAARGLARLRLASALPVGVSREAGGRPPFAGSPGYAVAFAATREPAWPMLAQGFLGGNVGAGETRRLGFAASPGAPVLDARGDLVGITLADADARTTWLPLSDATAAASPASAPARHGLALVAPDEIYEAGLRRALQVLVAPR